MNILIVGSGGREHAVADTLARNAGVQKMYAAPGNGGIKQVAELVAIPADDVTGILEFALAKRIDLTFVGPEVPLSKGIVDVFRQSGLKIVGPDAGQARLETSKGFAKHFFSANGIPTARFQKYCSTEDAYRGLDAVQFPIVIKADGLAAGKGVVIARDGDEARRAVEALMVERRLGEAGKEILIEEYLSGEEASFHFFVDGLDFQPMVVAQDHKRRFDGDAGPNTGGMGAYSVDTILSAAVQQRVVDSIIRPTVHAAKTYSGILYAGLMITSDGPKIIEYNARFGDPETQVILPRLKTDLLDVLVAISEHRLARVRLEWVPEAAATVVLVANSYPGNVQTGMRIYGLDRAGRLEGVKVFHAGTRFEDGIYYTAGGRVLNVTAIGSTLSDALGRAYAAAEMISFEGKDYRRDIGRKGLERER